MRFKWLHSKVAWVILFLEESQEVEAWDKLSVGQDLGKEDLGTFFLVLCQGPYPRKKDWKDAREIVYTMVWPQSGMNSMGVFPDRWLFNLFVTASSSGDSVSKHLHGLQHRSTPSLP